MASSMWRQTEKSFQGFASDFVFEAPADAGTGALGGARPGVGSHRLRWLGRVPFENPTFGRRSMSVQAGGEMQPDQTRRWRTCTGIEAVFRRKFDLPSGGCGLAGQDRKRRFDELHQRASIVVVRQQQVAGDLGRTAPWAPHNLPRVHRPAGLGKVHRR